MRASSLLPLLLVAAPLSAQDLDLERSGIPRSMESRIRAIAGSDATTRFYGGGTVGASEVVGGDVLVTDGTLMVSGTVRGSIAAIDADVVFDEGATVAGDVIVVRGRTRGAERAVLGGSVTIYGDGGVWDRARRTHGSHDRWGDDRWEDWGDADVRVGVAGNYNRVEGLPIAFGPDIRTGGRLGTRLEALAIWRTDVGPLTDSRPMGYSARVEQFLGSRAVRVGASLRSVAAPIEAWGVTDLEASLAAGLFHEDQRDYFEREGWSAYLRVAPRRSPLDLTVEYRDEDHASLATRDPWTLFNGDRFWREQPLVAEGRIRTIGGTFELDGARGAEFTRRGWIVRADVRHALDSELERVTDTVGDVFESGFTTGFVDLRRYQRAGWAGILALRAVGGGSFDERALPPQFQHALGGPGSMPGYALFAGDCGARDFLVPTVGGDPAPGAPLAYGAYGCDRFALFQAEFRGGFDVRFDPWDRDEWDIDTGIEWTVFFDAGRGWAYSGIGPARSDTGTLYDVGAGIVLGGLGVYGAVPLNGDDRDLRVIVRLGPRF